MPPMPQLRVSLANGELRIVAPVSVVKLAIELTVHVLRGTCFCYFDAYNPIRKAVYDLVMHPYFDQVILVVDGAPRLG